MRPQEKFQISGSDTQIPSRGLGTFLPDPGASEPNTVKKAVLDALKTGYRHIDTALRYGDGTGEREVGEAIRESGVPREEIFVVTKLENCFHAPEDVETGMDMSLKNLGLAYVDLYLMHFPYAYQKTENFGTQREVDGKPLVDVELSRAYVTTWKAMEVLVDKCKARLIGVSNFSTPKMEKLLASARIKPAVNQIEVHPHWPQKDLVKFCQNSGVHVTAFGPLGCTPIPALVGRAGPGPLDDNIIFLLGQKYRKSPAQMILCHLICRGISVIPKSVSTKRILENFDCLFEMDAEDFKTIDTLMDEHSNKGVRNLETMSYLGFDNYNELYEEP